MKKAINLLAILAVAIIPSLFAPEVVAQEEEKKVSRIKTLKGTHVLIGGRYGVPGSQGSFGHTDDDQFLLGLTQKFALPPFEKTGSDRCISFGWDRVQRSYFSFNLAYESQFAKGKAGEPDPDSGEEGEVTYTPTKWSWHAGLGWRYRMTGNISNNLLVINTFNPSNRMIGFVAGGFAFNLGKFSIGTRGEYGWSWLANSNASLSNSDVKHHNNISFFATYKIRR